MNKYSNSNSCCWDEDDFIAKQQEKIERIFRKFEKIGWRIGAKFNRRVIKFTAIILMILIVLTTGTFYFLKAVGKGVFKKR